MSRRLVLAVLIAAAYGAATPGLAAEKAEEGAQYVPVSPVAVPIVVDGRIVNYVFVTVRLELAPLANSTRLREKEPYFRDALVRAAHRTPFTLASDLTKVDEVKLKASLLREAQVIAGAGAIRSVTLVSQAPKTLRVPSR